MKGVILAGGTGSRLYPLTRVTNKHLLPVGHMPMIYYPINKLRRAGINNIMIVTGVEHMGSIVGSLGSGREFGCEFTFRVQDEAGGIAQALSLAEDFACGDQIAVILGDNVFQDDIGPFAERFRQQGRGARLVLKEVEDPERFGVAEVQGSKIVRIEEKPAAPKSKHAVTGIYFYDGEVFNIIKTLRPSARGEFEITDVNNAYIADSTMEFEMLQGWWTDAGTFSSLGRANELAKDLDGQFGDYMRKAD